MSNVMIFYILYIYIIYIRVEGEVGLGPEARVFFNKFQIIKLRKFFDFLSSSKMFQIISTKN